MPSLRGRPAFALLVLLVLAVQGCASGPARLASDGSDTLEATVPGFPAEIRNWADTPQEQIGAALAEVRDRAIASGRAPTMLALSGGADDGAYGAGFLNGWSERGARPDFTVVTGVSTGALLAPFAFLGQDYDDQLREMFTTIDQSNIFVPRPIAALFGGGGLASNAPLRSMVDDYVTPEVLAAIAREHQRGRRLIVVTTNLDAQRPVIWNMGLIAATRTPAAEQLFEDVLVASASIPAFFPPMLIEASVDGRKVDELHVDGGATMQVFTMPTSVLVSPTSARAPKGSAIYMIINNKLQPDFEIVEAGALPIAGRAFSTMVKASAQQTVLQTYDFARDRGIGFYLTYVGGDFDASYPGMFNREYMQALYQYGLERGRSASGWRRKP